MRKVRFVRQSFKKSNVTGNLDVATAGTAALRDLGNTPVFGGRRGRNVEGTKGTEGGRQAYLQGYFGVCKPMQGYFELFF
jgi:hypothetical protein